jgi:hypothetical protein
MGWLDKLLGRGKQAVADIQSENPLHREDARESEGAPAQDPGAQQDQTEQGQG